jgi:glycosyltransferase involved in cell wall biosynthesis
MGVPTVNLDMDDLTHPYRVRALTPAFDLVWTAVRENLEVIRGYGARKLVQMPFAANPHTFHPAATTDEVRAVCFVGACYGARARAIGSLARAGIPARVYGSSPAEVYGGERIPAPALRALFYWQEGWERLFKSVTYGTGRACIRAGLKRSLEMLYRDLPEKRLADGPVAYEPGPTFDQMPAYMSRAALSLGSMEVASTFVLDPPLFAIRFREFEAPMCGAVHLANAYPELKEYFEEDREMLFYEGFEDLVDKARFWLDPARDAQRREIRRRARARAEADHTWRHRFQRCFDELGVPATV